MKPATSGRSNSDGPNSRKGFFSVFGKIHADWETLCEKCGLCCYDRFLDGGGKLIVDLSSPCEFLNKKTLACSVYSERFRVCRDCKKLTIFHALFSRYLPSSCGYVKRYRFWKARSSSPSLIRSDVKAPRRFSRDREA